ncbi:leucine-rich_repeat domain-containing protein [Hexamita inflata]|uniref:Leucine-rich_repeat domain-containing protein n=1 Tax=Hexamita inflata TaxID=28002 RepID=A0ABP1IK53_9EUKA
MQNLTNALKASKRLKPLSQYNYININKINNQPVKQDQSQTKQVNINNSEQENVLKLKGQFKIQNFNNAIEEFTNKHNTQQVMINDQANEVCIDQENVIKIQQVLQSSSPDKLIFQNVLNIPKLESSSVKEITILKQLVQQNGFDMQQVINNSKPIMMEESNLENLKVLNLKAIQCVGLIEFNQIQNLVKSSKLQELYIENNNCTINDASTLFFLSTVQKLGLINAGLPNLDIFTSCANLNECCIRDGNIIYIQLQNKQMLIQYLKQIININVLNNFDIKRLEIKDCIVTKLSSNSVNELIITNCVCTQIDLQDLTNLERLTIIFSQTDQYGKNNIYYNQNIYLQETIALSTICLQSITNLKFIREINLTGFLVDITPLQNINSLIKVCLYKCSNINPQILSKSIQELVIIDCRINSINLQQYTELKILNISDQGQNNNYIKQLYIQNYQPSNIKYISNIASCSKLQYLTLSQCWQIEVIQQLRQLPQLELSSMHIQNNSALEFVQKVFKLNKLTEVNFQHCLIPKNGVLVVQNIIEQYILEYVQIFDIKKLEICDCNNVPALKQDYVKELKIYNCEFKSMNEFQLQNLEILNIQSKQAKYNEYSMKQFCVNLNIFSNLREIYITNYDVDISTFNSFQYLKQLQKVILTQCNNIPCINSETITEFITHRSKIKKLDDLYLPNLEVITLEDSASLNNQHIDNIAAFQNLKQICINKRNLDITMLQYCKQLIKIDFDSCSLCNIDVLRRLTNLQELSLAGNQIIYLDPLEKLTQLTALDISENCIQDFSAIQGHPNFKQYVQGKQYQASHLKYQKSYLSSYTQYMYDQEKNPQLNINILKIANQIRDINIPITLLNQMKDKRILQKQRMNLMKQNLTQYLIKNNNHVSFTDKIANLFQLFFNGESSQ